MADLTDLKTRTTMRGLMSEIDGDLRAAVLDTSSAEQNARSVRLHDSWAKVAAILDLGPEPEMRACPSCGKPARRDARRCGYCWTALREV